MPLTKHGRKVALNAQPSTMPPLQASEMNINVVKRIVAGLLLIAIAELPYGYYTFLRLIVFIVSIICVFEYFEKRNIFVIIFSIVAILFNPLIPVHLDKETWMPIDIITSVIFVISIFSKTKEEIHKL